MTLCIGALAQAPGGQCIVLCFDSKVSTDEFSSESEYKFRRLSNQLVGLFSDSPGRAKELALIYERYLKTVELTEENAVEHLREPFSELKNRLANNYMQRKLAISYQQLLDRGDDWLGKELRLKYISDIAAHKPRVSLIVAGFLGQTPLLYELRDGELEWRTTFSLIGSGAFAAEPPLHARNHTFNTLREDALYNVYEAKRIGETSPAVGRDTRMLILYSPNKDSKGHILADVVTPIGTAYLEKQFRRYGPRPVKKWAAIPEGGLQRAYFNISEGY